MVVDDFVQAGPKRGAARSHHGVVIARRRRGPGKGNDAQKADDKGYPDAAPRAYKNQRPETKFSTKNRQQEGEHQQKTRDSSGGVSL